MKIISLWSGPRNVSTALMYSFAQRPDTEVIDEPLYAHYLSRVQADHPGEQEVLQSMERNGNVVMEHLRHYPSSREILFLKNMAHHWLELDFSLLDGIMHIFLIRNPEDMLPSLVNQLKNPVLRDTGLKIQKELYLALEKQGREIPVIDSRLLLENPAKILKQACKMLDIPFYPQMLSWPKGARPEDGIWAKHWYHRVHQSTGFTPYEKKDRPFPERLRPLLEESLPYYQFLYERALKL